jgi:DNA-binding transcriptional MerR regulator
VEPVRAREQEQLALTIDQLAAATGTTTRRIRALQTLGLVPGPELRGRTGLYGPAHRTRLEAILRLQQEGFSLESLRILFDALDAGGTLASVLGVDADDGPLTHSPDDDADEYGFPRLQPAKATRGGRRALLSLVPTTLWDEGEAS